MMYARNKFIQPFLKTDKLCNFAPMPKSLLNMGLSSSAIIVYSLLLDRATLSQKHGKFDRQGWVYVNYKVSRLAEDLRKGETTIRKLLRELEDRELIFRTFPLAGEASDIYIRTHAGCLEGKLEEMRQAEYSTEFSTPDPAQKRDPIVFGGPPSFFEWGPCQK